MRKIVRNAFLVVGVTGVYMFGFEAPDSRLPEEKLADKFAQAYFTRNFARLEDLSTKEVVDDARGDFAVTEVFGALSVSIQPLSVKIPVLNLLGVTRLTTALLSDRQCVLVRGWVKTDKFTEKFALAVRVHRYSDGSMRVDKLYDVQPDGDGFWRLHEHKGLHRQMYEAFRHFP